jgi:phosphoribosylanthranilate isomerase
MSQTEGRARSDEPAREADRAPAARAVKICGIRDEAAGAAAIESGASMLGFNFYPPSPRYIDPASCAALIRGLRKVGPFLAIGVFVDEEPAAIAAIARATGLDAAQLAGAEPAEDLAALWAAGIPAFKAIRPRTMEELRAQVERYAPARQGWPAGLPELLVDAWSSKGMGGNGERGDWGLAAEAAREWRILLAGGLDPGNVSAALEATGAWGADVASGVERERGLKDPALIRAFLEAAQGAPRCAVQVTAGIESN